MDIFVHILSSRLGFEGTYSLFIGTQSVFVRRLQHSRRTTASIHRDRNSLCHYKQDERPGVDLMSLDADTKKFIRGLK